MCGLPQHVSSLSLQALPEHIDDDEVVGASGLLCGDCCGGCGGSDFRSGVEVDTDAGTGAGCMLSLDDAGDAGVGVVLSS